MTNCYVYVCSVVFFFNDTATTEIYTLSLHDALPIFQRFLGDGTDRKLRFLTFLEESDGLLVGLKAGVKLGFQLRLRPIGVVYAEDSVDTVIRFALKVLYLALPFDYQSYRDRKSTRLNSSHANISYAVFC